jgi:drug/metabolite transporter (DMT)-like permease
VLASSVVVGVEAEVVVAVPALEQAATTRPARNIERRTAPTYRASGSSPFRHNARPMSWLAARPAVAATLGALVIAMSAILFRLAAVTPATAAVFRCLYALPLLALLARRETTTFGPVPRRIAALAAVAGLFFCADLIFWHHAIEEVGAGLATVLGNTQVIFVPLLAWLALSESPSRALRWSVSLVMAGVVLISGVGSGGAYGRNPGLGVAYGVATGLTYAGFILVQRSANRDDRRPAGPLLVATASAGLASLGVGWLLGEIDLRISLPAHGWLLLLGLGVHAGGWLLISIGLPRLPAAVTSVLLTIQPVASVLLGRLIFSEAPSPLQLGGVALVVAGLVVTGRDRTSGRVAQ